MKKFLFNIFFVSTFFLFGQGNLVPNPSFESYTSCPSGSQAPNEVNLAAPWYNPTACSPDYYNSCSSGIFNVPSNIWGFQQAYSGSAYIGIATYGGTSSTREYVQIQLTDSLIPNHFYDVAFFASPTFNSSYKIAISELSLLFSDTAITSTGINVLNFTPQISSQPGVFLSDTMNWTQISGTYIAVGGEKYITIGNFKNDANTDTVDFGSNAFSKQAYYYIDDVSVIDMGTAGIQNYFTSPLSISLYPNPTTGKVFVSVFDGGSHIHKAEVYDLSGNLVIKKDLEISNGVGEIKLEVESGLYLLHLIPLEGGKTTIHKIVISK